MIYFSEPDNFIPKFEVVSCFVEYKKKILLLHRQNHKNQGNTWGVPAGKMDKGESSQQAVIRELYEETGIEAGTGQIGYSSKLFVRYPDYDFIYHIFHLPLKIEPEVKINIGEHKAHKWLTPNQSLKIDLIQDLDSCIKLFYKI